MKIIFLDIDGVLNNRKSDTLLFECDPSNYKLDENNLKCLDYILNNVKDCKIILSTSWRNYPINHTFINRYGWEYYSLIPDLLKRYNNFIIASAPHEDGRNKYDDIKDMLSKSVDLHGNDITIDDFVVIDDDPTQGLQGFGEQYFKTFKETGLTEDIAKDIIEYFNSYYSFV